MNNFVLLVEDNDGNVCVAAIDPSVEVLEGIKKITDPKRNPRIEKQS